MQEKKDILVKLHTISQGDALRGRLGPALRKCRLAEKQTLEQYARKIGICTSYLSQIERGKRLSGAILSRLIRHMT